MISLPALLSDLQKDTVFSRLSGVEKQAVIETAVANIWRCVNAKSGFYRRTSLDGITSSDLCANRPILNSKAYLGHTLIGSTDWSIYDGSTGGAPLAGTARIRGVQSMTSGMMIIPLISQSGKIAFAATGFGRYLVSYDIADVNGCYSAVVTSTIELTHEAATQFSISGFIRNVSGVIIPGATVKIFLNNVIVATTTSEALGDYIFEDRVNGTYRIEATKQGYSAASHTVTVNGADVTADLVLGSGCDNKPILKPQFVVVVLPSTGSGGSGSGGTAPLFTTQPTNVSVQNGNEATLSGVVSGATNLKVQISSDGNTWTDLATNVTLPYQFTPTSADNGKRLRIVATNATDTTFSDVVVLTVQSSSASTFRLQGVYSGLKPWIRLNATSASSAVINWGDGSAPETVVLPPYGNNNLTHTYTQTGDKTVTIDIPVGTDFTDIRFGVDGLAASTLPWIHWKSVDISGFTSARGDFAFNIEFSENLQTVLFHSSSVAYPASSIFNLPGVPAPYVQSLITSQSKWQAFLRLFRHLHLSNNGLTNSQMDAMIDTASIAASSMSPMSSGHGLSFVNGSAPHPNGSFSSPLPTAAAWSITNSPLNWVLSNNTVCVPITSCAISVNKPNPDGGEDVVFTGTVSPANASPPFSWRLMKNGGLQNLPIVSNNRVQGLNVFYWNPPLDKGEYTIEVVQTECSGSATSSGISMLGHCLLPEILGTVPSFVAGISNENQLITINNATLASLSGLPSGLSIKNQYAQGIGYSFVLQGTPTVQGATGTLVIQATNDCLAQAGQPSDPNATSQRTINQSYTVS